MKQLPTNNRDGFARNLRQRRGGHSPAYRERRIAAQRVARINDEYSRWRETPLFRAAAS